MFYLWWSTLLSWSFLRLATNSDLSPHLLFFLALLNNLFSFVTLRRRPCLRYGIGHFLLAMSVINQLTLLFFVARLSHLIVKIDNTSSSPSIGDDLLCKFLNYCLSPFTRIVYWLTSLISIERLCTWPSSSIVNGWINPASRVVWFSSRASSSSSLICMNCSFINLYRTLPLVKDRSVSWRSRRMSEHFGWRSIFFFSFSILFSSSWSISPRLSPLFWSSSRRRLRHFRQIRVSGTPLIDWYQSALSSLSADQVDRSNLINVRRRLHLIVDVLRENQEFVIGPTITVIPQLFSLPLFISSFVFDFQNLENSWLRHFLIVSYWISLTPLWTSFFLYISPSSFYSSEWHKTDLGRWINHLLHRHSPVPTTKTFIALSGTQNIAKDKLWPDSLYHFVVDVRLWGWEKRDGHRLHSPRDWYNE